MLKRILGKISHKTIFSTTANASQQLTPHFVDRLADIALRQDTEQFDNLKLERGNNFNINQCNQLGNSALHVLMAKIDVKELPAVQFLLKCGASLAIKNNDEQTPLHTLAISGSSSLVLKFWESQFWLITEDTHIAIDAADNSGKTLLHYLMMKPGDENIGVLLKKYFWLRTLDIKDTEGNTPLHLAAQYGNTFGIDFFLSLTNEEYNNANKLFIITNDAGETPADIARATGNAAMARKLYRREFIFTPFHDYLRKWFEKEQKKLLSSTETVADYHKRIIMRLKELAKTVIIASSEINDSIKEIFKVLNIDVADTDEGIEISLDNSNFSHLNTSDRRKIYELTPIGRLEWMLRDSVMSNLPSFAQDDLDEQEKEYDDSYHADCAAYEDKMRDFSDGDDEHDGANRPKPPVYQFSRSTANLQLQKMIDRNDLNALLDYVSLEKSVMGQMLYDDFIGMDLAEELIEHLNKSDLGIPPVLLSSLILSFDFQFGDLDISKDGFLIAAIDDNFNSDFANAFSKIEAKQLALDFIETCGRSDKLVDDICLFNQATKRGEPLTVQQIWFRVHPFLIQFVAEKTKCSPTLKRSLSNEFTNIIKQKPYINLCEKTNNLIKIFPTDESRTLYYKSGSGKELVLDLKPLFKTLQTIAKDSHQLIVNYSNSSKNSESTNVITAYLLMAVTAKDNSGNLQQQFIRVPLVLNLEKKLLSKDIADGIFASAHDFHVSVAEDREHGARIAHREPNINVVSTGEIAKQDAQRLLSCFNLSEAEKQQVKDMLQRAQVDKPLQLDYELKAPVQQATLFNHSEQVIFKALKMPVNITRIVNSLYEQCQQKFTACTSYQVETGCLLLYSYPNSVCDECSLAVLALQDSEKGGFIYLLIQELSKRFCSSQPGSTLPLFSLPQSSGSPYLPLTTIVASEKIFPKDSYANILNTYPTAKTDHFVDGPRFFSRRGISLSTSTPDHLYEFVATDLSNVAFSVPYGGSVAMSGSKEDKLGTQIRLAEKEVAKNIEDYDAKMQL